MILGLPYPFALAVIAGILDLIPNIGATTAGIIIGIVALSVSVQALIIFLIVIVVYQQIENYILQPTIIGKAADVSGFTVLVSVLAFGALFGLIGAIIAVPIAAGIQIIVEELTAPRRAAASPPRTPRSSSRPNGAAHTRCERLRSRPASPKARGPTRLHPRRLRMEFVLARAGYSASRRCFRIMLLRDHETANQPRCGSPRPRSTSPRAARSGRSCCSRRSPSAPTSP